MEATGMAATPREATGHADSAHQGGMRVMYFVWMWLLTLTVAEVLLAYFHVPLTLMLLLLLGMSMVKAVLIVAYFMHLRFERMSLVLTLIPACITAILLFNVIFPDSDRLGTINLFR
jgi:cytochrome c oxidase subunit 4